MLTDIEDKRIKGFLEDVIVEVRRAAAKFGPIHSCSLIDVRP